MIIKKSVSDAHIGDFTQQEHINVLLTESVRMKKGE